MSPPGMLILSLLPCGSMHTSRPSATPLRRLMETKKITCVRTEMLKSWLSRSDSVDGSDTMTRFNRLLGQECENVVA
jgi:hypothetical protein